MSDLLEDMCMLDVYFIQNKDWYYIDDNNERGLQLTELGKSIPEVVSSYNSFYADTGNLIY